MALFLVKTVLSALIIAIVSELSRRMSLLGSLLASLPLTTILIFLWIYFETKDVSKISQMSWEIFWLVIPSLIFFISLPLTLKKGISFPWAMGLSSVFTIIGYYLFIFALKKLS